MPRDSKTNEDVLVQSTPWLLKPRSLLLVDCSFMTFDGLTSDIARLPDLQDLHCHDCAGLGKVQEGQTTAELAAVDDCFEF